MKKLKNANYIFLGIIGLLVIAIGVVSLFKFVLNNDEVLSDASKFKEEYTEVDEDNVFVYRSIDEIINILEKGTGVVYLGFPECKWCQRYVKYLNEVAKEMDVEKIYYYNIKEDRENNTSDYQKIIELLGDYIEYDEEGNPRIYVPEVIYVNKGNIVAHDNETSMESGDVDEYWSQDKINSLKERTRAYMQESNPNMCTDGCNG